MRRRQRGVVVRFSGNGSLTFLRQLDVVADAVIYALTHDTETRFTEVRGKSETSEHNRIFVNKTAGRGSLKRGSGRPISIFPRTFGIA